jgi:hypothetical protein
MVLSTEVIEKMDLFILQLIHNKMKAVIEEISITYSQECDESSNDIQELKMFTNDNGACKYIVFQTQRWAIDNIDELVEILNDFKLKAGI